MFEDITLEGIKTELLRYVAEQPGAPSTREGSFAEGVIAGAAYELWKVFQSLNSLVPIAFVDESSGGYLDLEGEKYGMARKPGTRAAAVVRLTGRPGAVIPKGTAFVSAGGLVFLTDTDAVLDAVGAGSAGVTAEAVGAAYNLAAGALERMFVNLAELTAWESGEAQGGTDGETDAAFFARIDARRKRPATSGNVYHYEQWALEVNGVGGCRVTPLWDGPGTVKVLIVDGNKGPAAGEIVEAVKAHIEAERPVGAAVTVVSAQGLEISVSAAVTTDGSVTAEQVQARFAEALGAYLRSVAFVTYTLLYNRVAFLLLSVEGVTDYTALTVNGGTANVAIGADQVPVLGEVTVV